MKTEIWINHHYGCHEIIFKKEFELSFAPFFGMFLLDVVGDSECQIELANNQYVSTMIMYYAESKSFNVDVRHNWTRPVTDETVDEIIQYFTACKWERQDDTNIADLKELMQREYKRTN